MKHSQVLASSIAVFAALSACSSGEGTEEPTLPIASSQAALTASENSAQALEGVLAAGDFIADAETLQSAWGSSGMDDGASCVDTLECLEPDVCNVVSVCDDSAADLPSRRDELRQSVDEFVEQLRTRILIPENLESETETSATYLLGPEDLCDADDEPECADQVTELEPRLVLTSPSEGDINVKILLGSAQRQTLALELHHDTLAVAIDLGQTFAVAGEIGDAPEDITTMSGRVELRLLKHTDTDYSVRFSVLQAVSIEGTVTSEDTGASTGQYEVSLGATTPTVEVRANGDTRTLTGTLNLGNFRVSAPATEFLGLSPNRQRAQADLVELFVAGVTGSLSYTGESDGLLFQNLSLGDQTSTLRHGSDVLAALDINPSAGRSFNLAMSALGGSQEGLRLQFEPSFEMKLRLAFNHLADRIEEQLPAFLLDDTLTVKLTGSNPELAVRDEAVEVVSGTLAFESAASASGNLSVPAGQCLVEADEPSDSELPWSELAAAVCE